MNLTDSVGNENGEKGGFRPWVFDALLSLAVALVPLAVIPGWGNPFELPKRLAWGVVMAVLAGWGWAGAWKSRPIPPSKAFGLAWECLAGWMFLRALGVPWGRVAGPLAVWMLPLALFGIAAAIPWREETRQRVAKAVAVSGLLQASLMLLQRWGLDPLWGAATARIAYAPGRMLGTIGYQNQAAEFLGLAAVCALFGCRRRWMRWGAVAVLAGTAALTANRGALAGLAAAGVAWGLAGGARSWRRTAAWGLAGLVLVGIAATAIPEVRGRVAELARPERSVAVQSRLWMWRVAVAMGREHPLAGCGAGSYAYGYMDRLGTLLPEKKRHRDLSALVYAREAHCDTLQFLAEFGLAGVTLLAWLVWGAAAAARRSGRKERRAAVATAAFMGTASLVSFCWQSALAGPLAGVLLGMWIGGGNASPGHTGARIQAFVLWAVALATGGILLQQALWAAGVASGGTRGRAGAETAARLLAAGEVDGARAVCERMLVEAVSPSVLRNCGAASAAAGRWEEALAAYERWGRSGLEYGEVLRNQSVCLERLGRLGDAAEKEYERLRLFPGSLSDRDVYRLVVLCLRSGNPARALKVAELFRQRCGRKNPSGWTPEWENLLGSVHAALGEREKARTCFGRALAREPGLASARRNLEALEALWDEGP